MPQSAVRRKEDPVPKTAKKNQSNLKESGPHAIAIFPLRPQGNRI